MKKKKMLVNSQRDFLIEGSRITNYVLHYNHEKNNKSEKETGLYGG